MYLNTRTKKSKLIWDFFPKHINPHFECAYSNYDWTNTKYKSLDLVLRKQSIFQVHMHHQSLRLQFYCFPAATAILHKGSRRTKTEHRNLIPRPCVCYCQQSHPALARIHWIIASAMDQPPNTQHPPPDTPLRPLFSLVLVFNQITTMLIAMDVSPYCRVWKHGLSV